MNYKKIYDDLMQSRLLMKEARISARKTGEYFEAHHIVPASMGGDGKRTDYRHSNIVILTAREHYIAHALLFLIYRTREMITSFHLFCTIKNGKNYNYKVSARMYEFLKQERSRIGVSDETKIKMSVKLKGRTVSEETKEKLRKSHTGKKLSEIHRLNMSKSRTGKTHSEETKEKLRKSHTGKKMSSEAKQKMSKFRKGKKYRLGVTSSDETKRKIAESKRGNTYRRGSTHTEEAKEKIRQSWIKRREEKMNMTK